MIKIQIDGKIFEVKADKNLLQTCLSLGFDIPYFCYHPALGSVGSCRLCAVKKFRNDTDTRGQIIMSCMEPVTDGMIISVSDPEVKAFRASVIESLMLNHPHDCPVCDEGGECHLQDMTVMTGHNYRRFDFKKRTYLNQYLGPFIKHEMNRCIQCYRCVRFYREYAGGKDLNVFGSANQLYFGRTEEGVLESEFSGNLIEICPTGVFTDKVLYKSYSRKWDLTNAPSVCVHCSLGCNTIASERYGSLKRIMNRYNGDINGYLLCDRGRFGYEFVNDDKIRLNTAQTRYSKTTELEDKGNEAILSVITCAIYDNKVATIGSPRASLESNYALQKLFGKENFYHGVSNIEKSMVKTIIDIYQNGQIHSPSLKEIESADAILILGEDVMNTAPMMALSVRQASRNASFDIAALAGIPRWNDHPVREMAQEILTPIFIASAYSTKLDELAAAVFNSNTTEIARLGFAVASIINNKAPEVKNLDKTTKEIASRIAKILQEAKNPLIISGTGSKSQELIQAAGNIGMALAASGKKANLSFVLPEANSMGLGMMEGGSLEEVIELVKGDKVKTLVILENDLYRRTDQNLLSCLSDKCPQVIVLDHTKNATTDKADILFPVTTFAESCGTIINNEGRAQRYFSIFPPKANIKDSWQWLKEMMQLLTKNDGAQWQHFDDVVTDMCKAYPEFTPIKEIPNASFRIYNEKISRQTHRFSGRTSMNANKAVSEPRPPQDLDSPLNFSMEGYKGIPPAPLIPFYWSPGWNSVQAVNKYLDEPAGSNKDGNSGIRLFDNKLPGDPEFFTNIPDIQPLEQDDWYLVPVYQIFGSEELSSKGKAIGERISEPFIIMNKSDIEKSGLNENERYRIKIQSYDIEFTLRSDERIPERVAGISVDLPGVPFINASVVSKLQFIKTSIK